MDGIYRDLLDVITFGVVEHLVRKTGVCDVHALERSAASDGAVASWEQKHGCLLPDDLKTFYLTTDGLFIQWSVKCNGAVSPVGQISINSLAELTEFAACDVTADGTRLLLIDDDRGAVDKEGRKMPSFSGKNFVLDNCGSYGNVCLCYLSELERTEIWLLDWAHQWHFLSATFMSYYRMLLVHLGIPGWQYAFTEFGPSPDTQAWCNLYLPDHVRLSDSPPFEVLDGKAKSSSHSGGSIINILDISRLFHQRFDRKKPVGESSKQGRLSPTKSKAATRAFKSSSRSPLK